jgi:putative FmdB family regulatory protein
MPIYEYRCCQCGTEFERLRPMGRADEAGPCPQCGSSEVARCVSTFASFAREGGTTRAVAGGGSSCSTCSASSCSTCGKG